MFSLNCPFQWNIIHLYFIDVKLQGKDVIKCRLCLSKYFDKTICTLLINKNCTNGTKKNTHGGTKTVHFGITTVYT